MLKLNKDMKFKDQEVQACSCSNETQSTKCYTAFQNYMQIKIFVITLTIFNKI